MSLLQAGVDTTVIALWLGHADVRSTQPYLHADLTIKEKALALVTPADVKPGRYKPPDTPSRSSKACDYADKPAGATAGKPRQPKAFRPAAATMSA